MGYISLQDKVAIVTGAGGAIGRAIALRLAADGARLVIADIAQRAAEETVAMISDVGGYAVPHQLDVSSGSGVAQLVAATTSKFGGIDIMVANAGTEAFASLLDTTETDFDHTLAVNTKGVWLCTKHAAPAIAERGGGAIINTASVAGESAIPGMGAYCASKAGVISLTKVAAAELRPLGIRVNAICPGFIDTPMFAVAAAGFAQTLPDRITLQDVIVRAQGRLGDPGEVAELAAFLASDASRFCSGTTFVIDNALTSVIPT